MGFALTIAGLAALALICDYVLFFVKKDSNAFKYVTISGYLVVYTLALLNARNDLVFAMAFPIFVMYVLYFDTLFMGIISGIFALINVIFIIAFFVRGSMPSGISIELSTILISNLNDTTSSALDTLKAVADNNNMSITNEAKNLVDSLVVSTNELDKYNQ